MSPRAACRLDTLGFNSVYDYVGGKADWLANGLPREGTHAGVLRAGELADTDPPTCSLSDTVGTIRAALEGSRYGFYLVISPQRIVLGRVRRSGIASADDRASVESVMEPGPSTVRFDIPAPELAQRLAAKDLITAVVTTPSGCLVGVFHRADADRRLTQTDAT